MRRTRLLGLLVLALLGAACSGAGDDEAAAPATATSADPATTAPSTARVPAPVDVPSTGTDLPVPLVVSRRAVLATDLETAITESAERPDGTCQVVALDSVGIEDPERPGVFVPDYRDATPDTALATYIAWSEPELPAHGWHRLDATDGSTVYAFADRDGVLLASVVVETALGRYGVTTAMSCDGLDADTEPDVDGDRFAPLSVDPAVGPYDDAEVAAQAANDALLEALEVPAGSYADVTVVEPGSDAEVRDAAVRTWSIDGITDRCAIAVDLVAQLRAAGLTGMALTTADPAGGTIWVASLSDGDLGASVSVRTSGDDVAVRVQPDIGIGAADGVDMPCVL